MRTTAILWTLLLAAVTLAAGTAVGYWAWDGMWENGAMPTHGMLYSLGGAAATWALFGLRAWLGRRR